jgi:PAS domain S-box-containing protein
LELKQSNKFSFYIFLAVVLFFITAVVISLQIWYNYHHLKYNLDMKIRQNTQISLQRIEKRIAPYIHSSSIKEYLNLIENEMDDKNIYAIVIEDYKLGNILGEKLSLSGKIRDNHWNIIDLDTKNKKHLNSLQSKYYKLSHVITDQNQNSLATVFIYSTDKFMDQILHDQIVHDITLLLFIYLIYLGILYFMIHHFFLKPTSQIINSLKKTDTFDLPKMAKIDTNIKEVEVLYSSLSKMIKTIKESRRTQNEQKQELQVIFDYSKDGIFIMDTESNFLTFNDAYLQMTGFTKEELLNKSCLEITMANQRDNTIQAIKEVIEKKQLENFEKICVVKDAKQLNMNMSMALLPDRKRILVTVKDMTHIKFLESQAKLAAMGEMIGNIAHQWRQPLTVISTSASGAKIKKRMDILDDEDFEKTMGTIVEQTKYLSQTIDDFRDFINHEYKEQTIFTISETLKKAFTLISASLDENHINLIKYIEQDGKILGYQNEIIQVMINLLNNAKDALVLNQKDESERYIFVVTKQQEHKFIIQVKDNAGGIVENDLSRIFEPYFTTKHQSVGTGIGLYMSRDIISNHHQGTIEVKNESFIYDKKEYMGAEFSITLKSVQ